MKNNSVRKKCFDFIFWIIAFIFFLPVIILPPDFQPSDWNRVALFKITLTLLLVLFIYRFFYKKDVFLSLPKLGYLFYLPVLGLSAYFIILIISTVFSQDPFFSVFGSPTRAGGLLNLLFFFIFALFIAFSIKGQVFDKLIKISFIAGILASILAIVQYFNLFKNIFLGFESGATPSFLGNSTFLAIYMIFLLFAAFNFFFLEEEKKKKWFFAILSLLFLFTILATSSRAAYLAVLVGFTFYFLFYPKNLAEDKNNLIKWINPKKLKIFKISSFILIFLILSVLIYVNTSPKLPNFIENNEKSSFFVHNRLSFKTLWQDLAGTRLSVWKITLKAIKEKPIFGWGPENFHIGFEKYFNPTLSPGLQRLWWDRPHNIFLEAAVDAGILAFIVYVVFWITLLWQLQIVKKYHSESAQIPRLRQGYGGQANDNQLEQEQFKLSHTAHVLQAMFIAYLVVLFFNFNSVSTYLISFFFIGYALYLISLKIEKVTIASSLRFMPIQKYLGFLGLAAIAVFLWFWSIKPFYFNEKLIRAKNLSEAKLCQKAIDVANSSDWEKSGIIRPYAALTYSDIVIKCTFVQAKKEAENATKAFGLLKTASKIQTKYSRTWILMGSFTNILAAREQNSEQKNNLLSKAREYLARAQQLSPKRQEVLIEMEKNYMLAEDYKSMEKIANDCIAIDPNRGECYWYLGIAQIFMSRQEEGKKNISISKEKGYSDPPYIQLAAAYLRQKNYKDAAGIYENLVAIYPQNASYHSVLAILYREIGKYERARLEAMEVFRLRPEDPETIEFIKLLLGLHPNDLQLHSSLASIYKQLGREEEMRKELLIVLAAYQQNAVRNPKNPDNHFSLANIYKELKDYDKAAKEALITLSLDSSQEKKVNDFLLSIPYSKNVKISFYEELVSKNPRSPYHRLNLAVAYRESQEYEKAYLGAIKTIELDPGYTAKVESFLRSLPPEYLTKYLALHYLQKIAKEPNNYNHHFNLALVYKDLGEYQKSFQEALIALKLAPDIREKIEELVKLLPPEYLDKYKRAQQ